MRGSPLNQRAAPTLSQRGKDLKSISPTSTTSLVKKNTRSVMISAVENHSRLIPFLGGAGSRVSGFFSGSIVNEPPLLFVLRTTSTRRARLVYAECIQATTFYVILCRESASDSLSNRMPRRVSQGRSERNRFLRPTWTDRKSGQVTYYTQNAYRKTQNE